MPIRRIKAQSPDPYLGKIQGDTELARLAHLNYVIDAINNGGGGGGGSLTVNGDGPVNNLYITFNSGSASESYDPNTDTYAITYIPQEYDPGYKAYRAKIAMQTIDWPGYGYLYNWYAVADVRGLANPAGGSLQTPPNEWRVPSDTDYTTLETFAGGSSVAGGKLKSTLTSTAYPFYGWLDNGGGTDDYNFEGLPGGYRSQSGGFIGVGFNGNWWTITSTNSFQAFAVSIVTNANSFIYAPNGDKPGGCSVRLVREATPSELSIPDGTTSNSLLFDPYQGNDGKGYVTVKIGTQIWLAQNLRETKYNDNSDIFNASGLFGGDFFNGTWEAKGIAQEGAWAAYRFNDAFVEYDPTTVKLFYNDVLENTLGEDLNWLSTSPCPSCTSSYNLVKQSLQTFKKTHIKITPGYDVSDLPTINERSLLIQQAVEGEYEIVFRPIKKDGTTGAITTEDLNNYPGSPVSYVYVEILEYPPAYYGSGLSVALGASNLEDEEEIVALTYEINGVTYTEDLEAKKLSIEIAKIYDQLGIFDKYKV